MQAALCAALGGVGSYVYVAWLCADVDRVSPNDDVPMVRANNIRDTWPRRFARLVAGVRQQLQPRLLVRDLCVCIAQPLRHALSHDYMVLHLSFPSCLLAHLSMDCC